MCHTPHQIGVVSKYFIDEWEQMKKLVMITVGLLMLTGCSAQSGGSSVAPTPDETSSMIDETTPDGADSGSTNVDSALPSEWTSTEVKIFNLFSSIYPSSAIMDLNGKRALMENAELICQAYGEGYSRYEIQSATSGAEFTAEMSDDWMTLAVTYLCPEYLYLQTGN
jgi:hypothetical protein